MNEHQLERFLLLTSSFMATMAQESYLHNRSMSRALEEAMCFEGVTLPTTTTIAEAAFKYASWVTKGGTQPVWLPPTFRLAYVGK
jgi:hypothetical protein